MHLRTDIAITAFLDDVKKCTGTVYYETSEGDILNLSSSLSQFVFCTIAAHPHYWETGTVRCENREDYIFLENYLITDGKDCYEHL